MRRLIEGDYVVVQDGTDWRRESVDRITVRHYILSDGRRYSRVTGRAEGMGNTISPARPYITEYPDIVVRYPEQRAKLSAHRLNLEKRAARLLETLPPQTLYTAMRAMLDAVYMDKETMAFAHVSDLYRSLSAEVFVAIEYSKVVKSMREQYLNAIEEIWPSDDEDTEEEDDDDGEGDAEVPGFRPVQGGTEPHLTIEGDTGGDGAALPELRHDTEAAHSGRLPLM